MYCDFKCNSCRVVMYFDAPYTIILYCNCPLVYCKVYMDVPGESKNTPAFERLLLPEHIRSDILQYLIE